MQGQLVSLADAAEARSEVGGKARNLGRLAIAGAPVPEGFAVSADAVARLVAGDRELAAAVAARAADLGPLLAVRSSAGIEDRVEGAAPGLFESITQVAPAEVVDAIARVAASASRPAVAAYRRLRGLDAADASIAVVVQRFVSPTASGVAYTRFAAAGDELAVESGGERPALARLRRRDGALIAADADFPLAGERLAALWRAVCAAEDAIAAADGADVEWVDDGEQLWIVQARPIVPRAPLDPEVAELIAFSRAEPRAIWRLDASHNPDPMSPAQIGLVERVAPLAPYQMRVVGGYLYTAADDDAPAEPEPALDAEALRRFADEEIGPAIAAALAPVETPEPPALADALTAYERVFSLYAAQLAPAVSRARRLLAEDAAVAGHPFGRALADAAAGRLARAELDRLLAPASPAWDVCVPTYGERPELIERAIDRYQGAAASSPDAGALASAVLELAERDDLWFFRAQAAVRRSLLALARAWRFERASDIFFLPLPEVERAAAEGAVPADAAARAEAARARRDRQRRRAMPLAFRAGHPTSAALPASADVWRGRGTGGVAEGRVVRVAELGSEPQVIDAAEATVLVTPAVTPATLLSAFGAAAVVCEHGGLLGHGAAMARELGVPCVVGCTGAWRDLRDGDRVLVDGDSGLVVRVAD